MPACPNSARTGRPTRSARTSWPRRWPPSSPTTGPPSSAGAAAPPPSTCAGSSSGSATCRPGSAGRRWSRRPPRCTSRCRSGRRPACSWSGSGPTRTGRRRSGRRCWPAAGTTAWRSPGRRSGTARTCWTCASTTSAGTVWPTCGRSPAGSPPRPRCR